MSAIGKLLESQLQLLLHSPTPAHSLNPPGTVYHSTAQQRAEWQLWQLLWQLDEDACRRKLGHCFPIVDRHSQGREFRQAVLKWLEQLRRDQVLPADCQIRRSTLDECRGERFDRLLLDLAVAVMKRRLRSLCDADVYCNLLCGSELKKLSSAEKEHRLVQCRLSMHLMEKQFHARLERDQEDEKMAKELAGKLEDRYAQLQKSIEEKEKKWALMQSAGSNVDLASMRQRLLELRQLQQRVMSILQDPQLIDSMEVLVSQSQKLHEKSIHESLDDCSGRELIRAMRLPKMTHEHRPLLPANPLVDRHGHLDLSAYFQLLQQLIVEYRHHLQGITQSSVDAEIQTCSRWRQDSDDSLATMQQLVIALKQRLQDLQVRVKKTSIDHLPSTSQYPLSFVPHRIRLPAANFSLTRRDSLTGQPTPIKYYPPTPAAIEQLRMEIKDKPASVQANHSGPDTPSTMRTNAIPRVKMPVAPVGPSMASPGLQDIKSKLQSIRQSRFMVSSAPVSDKENQLSNSQPHDNRSSHIKAVQTPARPQQPAAMSLLMDESPNLVDSPAIQSRSASMTPAIKKQLDFQAAVTPIMSTVSHGIEHEDSIDLLALDDDNPDWSMVI